MLGVNPWRLMTWMGSQAVQAAASAEVHSDRRIVEMLSARLLTPWVYQEAASDGRGNGVATGGGNEKAQANCPGLSVVSLAGWTGLEPAASGVTGRRYNRLNYHPMVRVRLLGASDGGRSRV